MGRPRPEVFAHPLAVWEREGLSAAPAKAGLATDDAAEAGRLFWRFEEDDVPVGFGGLEICGSDALLRSLGALPPVRRRGIGQAMVAWLETEARGRGAQAVYVLTTDAVPFFAALGDVPCDRPPVPAAIAATREFAALCGASALAMAKRL